MTSDSEKILFHISKVVDSQSAKLDVMQKELHQVQIELVSLRASGQIITPVEQRSEKLKDRAVVGTVGGAVATLVNYIVQYFSMKS